MENPDLDITSVNAHRYWMLNEDEFGFNNDQLVTGKNLTISQFPSERYLTELQTKDIVLFWREQEQPGIYGWGEVERNELNDEPGHESRNTTIIIHEYFASPVPRSHLLNEPENFIGLSILRDTKGVLFRVTSMEALALIDIITNITKSSLKPVSTEYGDGFFSASTLAEYRYYDELLPLIKLFVSHAAGDPPLIYPKLIIQLTIDWALGLAEEVTNQQPAIKGSKGESLPSPPQASWFAQTFSPEVASRLDYKYSASWQSNASEVNANAPMQAMHTPESDASFDKRGIKRKALNLIHTARRAAILTTGHERIAYRHLLGAVLHAGADSFISYLQEIIFTDASALNSTRRQFLHTLEEHELTDEIEVWRTLFSENDPATNEPLALLASDMAEGEDRLNIEPNVNAFASLLTAIDADPPIAIGLFGDWGSGKTFFMKKISERIDVISDRVRNTKSTQPSAYCGKVAQVWFNAWHYSEGNLWASLANHFFKNLRTALNDIGYNDEEYRALIKRLGYSVDDNEAVQAYINDTRKQHQQLIEKQAQLEKKKIELEANLIRDAVRQKEHPEKQQKESQLDKDIEQFSKLLGIKIESKDDPSETLAELYRVAKEQKLFNNKTVHSLKAIWSNRGVAWKLILALTVTAAVIAPYTPVINSLILSFLSPESDIPTWVVSTLSGGIMILGMLSKTTLQLVKLFTRYKKIDELDKKIHEVGEQIEISDSTMARIRDKHPGVLKESFIKFVHDKAEQNSYEKHLSLMSEVQEDFKQLHDLMEMNKQNPPAQGEETLPHIERIVLYIDDLDRCDPKRVSEVLQAIHLILAFPLFMVVVGVDARWVGRSLKEQYKFLVHENNGSAKTGDPYAATTNDYLEKIFQVPFWLKPINDSDADNLIRGMLGKKSDKAETSSQAALKPLSGIALTMPDADNRQLMDFNTIPTEDEDNNFQPQKLFGDIETVNLNPESLKLSEAESEYMTRLAGIVGRSPRTVKRYVNLYRLLKSSDPRARTLEYSESSGPFRYPMFLLALITGRPYSSAWVLEKLAINHANNKSLSDVFPFQTQTTVIGSILKATIQEQNRHSFELLLMHFLYEDKATQNSCTPISDADLDVDLLNEWVDEVSRYGYREWHKINLTVD